jgi:Tfp pilus assembly protein PilZ
MFVVAFADLDAFSREFHENLSKGGIFVPTDRSVDLRSRVEVGIDLQFCDRHMKLQGEVVHCVRADRASAGGVPGLAVQFDSPVREICDAVTALVGRIPEPALEKPVAEPPSGADRRKSKRATARVAALVHDLDGVRIEGMARDLSTSGVQLSLTGDAPPVGQAVVVVLTNPSRKESLEVPSEVVRHVLSVAGDAVAIGIQFRPDAACRERTKNFMNRLRSPAEASARGSESRH